MIKSTTTKARALLCSLALVGMHLTLNGATLIHRYSFTNEASLTADDSVGGASGTLMGSASQSLGKVTLDAAAGTFVNLPTNMISTSTISSNAITFETWATFGANNNWVNLFAFGNTVSGAGGNHVWFSPHSGGGDHRLVVSSTQPGWAGGEQGAFAGGNLDNQTDVHVACVVDFNGDIAAIYVNGVQVAKNTAFTRALTDIINNFSYLGKSSYDGDPYLNAVIDEFRIYNGTLNPLEIAASTQSGADTLSVNFGTVTNINLVVPTTLLLGNLHQAQVTAAASGLANTAVDITGEPGLTYVSSDTGVLTVNASGNITAAGLGSATITATYILNGATNSSGKTISVISVPAKLIHRYSFTNESSFTVDDSVGGANGTVVGSGIQSGGKLTLDGLAGTYASLPANMITASTISNNAVTFETWASFGVNANWVNLFAFGNTVSGAGGNHLWFSPHTGGGDHRLIVSSTQPGWAGGEQGAFAPGNLDNQTNVHIACVVNFGRDQLAVYVNGARVAQNTAFTRELANIINNYSYLGKSTYDGDPALVGEIDEFRVYNGALSAQQIVASYQTSGPSSTNINPGSFTSWAFSAATTLPAGWQSTGVSVLGNWQFATNVSLIGDLDLTLSSSDTNVATISAAGLITAIAPGTTTLSATYQGNTSTQLLSVVNPTSTLVHRYAFNETSGNIVPDLVGTAHGVVTIATNEIAATNASWTGSGLVINTNTALGAQDTFVDLPDGIISALTNNASFEMWVMSYSPTSDYWIRLFDAGSLPGPPFPSAPNIYLSRGGRFDWSTGSMDAGAFATGVNTHLVVLYNDAQDQCKVFINGTQVAMSAAGATTLALGSITDTNIWLGRSLYTAPISTTYFDPYLQASYDEFRIYSGLLTPAQIMQNYLEGPNPVLPTLSFSVSGGNLNLLWSTNATGFVPMSSTVLGTGASWTAVGGSPTVSGTNYLLTVPSSPGMKYFRLQK